MNPLDWILALTLLYSVVRGVLRGFFREAFALGGLIAGILLACWFFRPLAVRMSGLIATPSIAQPAAFILIVVAVAVAASLLGRVLKRTASTIGLGPVDRAAGGAFGLVRGTLIGVALLLAVAVFLPASAWVRESKLAPYFLQGAHAVSFVVPDDLRHRILEGIAHVKHTAPDWIKQATP